MIPTIPSLPTSRLLLRAFRPEDASEVQRLAGDRAIADTTLAIPHPYGPGMAETWISTHAERSRTGAALILAVELMAERALVGSTGLELSLPHGRAELGYWIGKPYWGRGYCTEAARELIRFGFDTLGLNRIEAFHFERNPASGRVLQKVGMRLEGHVRQRHKRWDRFEDEALYAILRSEHAR